MHRVERATRRAALLLVFAGFWAGAGWTAAALPAHADGWQHCSVVKGSLVMNPGLTDVPTDQSVSLFARMTGCSREGGSGLLGATTGASKATCASLTNALLPTNATFAWAGGRTSTIALAFRSLPGSPNRLVLAGRVISGPGLGDRLDGGLHLSARFTLALQNSTNNHKRVEASRREQLGPLNGVAGDCTTAQPFGTIKVASYQSLKFSTTQPPTTTTSTTTTTTTKTTKTTAGSTTSTVPSAAASPVRGRRSRGPARRRPRRPLIRQLGAVGSTGSSGSSIDPQSVLGAVCIAAAAVLMVVLLVPSRRMRKRRAAARLVR